MQLSAKFQRAFSRAYGRPLQLARVPKDVPKDVDTFTAPELKAQSKFGEKKSELYSDLKGEAHSKTPFKSAIPNVDTIIDLAHFGSPAKGEYERTFNTVKDLFGHHEHGPEAWVAVNSVLSPQTAYLDHAGAASLIVANWLAQGKPKDEGSILRLVREANAFGKLHTPQNVQDTLSQGNVYDPETGRFRGPAFPEGKPNPKTGKIPAPKWEGLKGTTGNTFGGTTAAERSEKAVVRVLQNIEQLSKAMHDPAHEDNLYLRNSDGGHVVDKKGKLVPTLALLGGDGTAKVPNFALSYISPLFGSALDVHMSRLMFHPELANLFGNTDILSQLESGFGNLRDKTRIGQLIKKNAPSSEIVKLMLKYPELKIKGKDSDGEVIHETMPNFFKEMNSKLLDNHAYYMAYKHALASAAQKLGWKISEVQEAVWTGIVALAAANGVSRDHGIPFEKIQEALTQDAVRKGWQNHEAFIFPGLVNAYNRIGTSKTAIARVFQAKQAAAAASSGDTGYVPPELAARLRRTAAYIPGSNKTAKDAAGPLRRTIISHFTEQGVIGNPLLSKKRRLAKYDAPLDFTSALQRAVSANQQSFVQHMRKILAQSGITPHIVSPAVHDFMGRARVGLMAAGDAKHPNAKLVGGAWTGLLGRQPSMLAFQTHPHGNDSVYRFTHPDAAMVQQVLNQYGIGSRTFAPEGENFNIYVYDKGRANRNSMGQALQQLGIQADEWRGNGDSIGGKKEDMGRSQYRDVINQSEQSQKFALDDKIHPEAREQAVWTHPEHQTVMSELTDHVGEDNIQPRWKTSSDVIPENERMMVPSLFLDVRHHGTKNPLDVTLQKHQGPEQTTYAAYIASKIGKHIGHKEGLTLDQLVSYLKGTFRKAPLNPKTYPKYPPLEPTGSRMDDMTEVTPDGVINGFKNT